MSQRRTATAIPKRSLVDAILRILPEEAVRSAFHIGSDTQLRARLQGFTKAELLGLLVSTPEGNDELEEVERRYPLSSAPTLYLVKVRREPDANVLISKTCALADAGREGGIDYGEERAVRVVYVAAPALVLEYARRTIEVPLLYERRVEYTVCDPDSEEYGERKALYSLERAFVWLVHGYAHGIIGCSDFPAVARLVNFGGVCLGLNWALPDLTEEMLDRLAADASPRSATFSSAIVETATVLDVKTLTVSDPQLGERRSYNQVKHDPNREQTAGYFSNHPDLLLGGLGIARRYGRVWTPRYLDRAALLSLAMGLMVRTEEELSREYDRDLAGYVRYFGNFPAVVGKRRLRGKTKEGFRELVTALLRATKQGRETTLSDELLHTLVAYQKAIGLHVAVELDCPQCGLVIGQCPDHQLPFAARLKDDTLVYECPKSGCEQIVDVEEGFECGCGQVIPLAARENHLWMAPEPELLDAIREFFDGMEEVTWDGLFFIRGHTLRLAPTPSVPGEEAVSLADLRLWRIRARHHLRAEPSEQRRERLVRVLTRSKEKCGKKNYHPTHEMCDHCLAAAVSSKQVRNGDICLPRLLGLAISQGFDGVHHRHEIADVRYEDVLYERGSSVKLGIHLKSRSHSSRPQGLGRSVGLIKALYTQFFHSAYLALAGQAEFDVIGASVPNTVHRDVVQAFTRLANELGFSFLLIDEDEWVKIVDAVLEALEVEAEPGA